MAFISRHEKYRANPFTETMLDGIKIKRKQIFAGKGDHLLVSQETGEIDGHTTFMKVKQVDPEKFVKLYLSSLENFFELTTNAIRVLSYVFSITKPNQDGVLFDLEDAMKYTGYKAKATINRALDQLIENHFIARSRHASNYYINPVIFFNGDRITFANRYIKTKNPQELENKPAHHAVNQLPNQISMLGDE